MSVIRNSIDKKALPQPGGVGIAVISHQTALSMEPIRLQDSRQTNKDLQIAPIPLSI